MENSNISKVRQRLSHHKGCNRVGKKKGADWNGRGGKTELLFLPPLPTTTFALGFSLEVKVSPNLEFGSSN